MRVLLAEFAPRPGDLERNCRRVEEALESTQADLAVFPELFLTGYRLGDRLHRLAEPAGGPHLSRLAEVARNHHVAIAVGTVLAASARAGEIHNAAVLLRSDGSTHVQVKRYLPTYGPFEEGSLFTPTDSSTPTALEDHRVGLEICYDAFFPEVSRDLALAGADLLVVLSAAPVTSGRLFEKVLPARAVENALPLVYVNRVGVEDGMVFGGGSNAWDARGEPLPREEVVVSGLAPEEHLWRTEIDLSAHARWRPFRPVLRDLSTRPGSSRASPPSSPPPRTDPL